MSHEDLSEYMRGRYYISPSTLYSIATLSPCKEAYEVPVEGDWVTIAVIAQRENVRLSNSSPWDDQDGLQGAPQKVSKYLKLRLVDFGTPTADKTGATRGDALLNMLLFEASSASDIKDDDSKSRGKRLYKGGSGGAFVESAKYHEGAVIAVLNPTLLRPFKVSHLRPMSYAVIKSRIFRALKALRTLLKIS
jgi:minichromosome maintenance protein 10